jgi:tRNA(Ile)-lysidine synthase
MRPSRVVVEVRRFVKAHGIGGGGVVAVSGGADSVALLRALVEVGCSPLTAAHLNHQLRGADSDADEAFVRDLAKSLGIGFRSTRVDVAKAAAEEGDNLEATARRIRYGWLVEVASEVGVRWIATGHTADDQAETILHRLIRGTGLQGLRGIAPVLSEPNPPALEEPNPPAPFPKREGGERGQSPSSSPPLLGEGPGEGLPRPGERSPIIRPMLSVTRAGVLGYLASLGQSFREDASNVDPRFTRNRIRAELVPVLKTFNLEIVAILGRLAEQMSEAHEVVIEQAKSLLQRAERPRAGDRVILDRRELQKCPPLLVTSALRLVWEREGWPMGEMTAEHWKRAADIVYGATSAAEFPGGVTVRTAGQVVQLSRERN